MSDYTVQPNKVADLRNFINDLNRYYDILRRSMGKGQLSEFEKKEEDKQGAELLFALNHRVGFLGQLITELTGLTTVNVHGSECDMWVVALKIPPDKLAYSALGRCIQVTVRAMGQLENDIKTGIRDRKTGKIISPIGKSKLETKTQPTSKREPKDTAGQSIIEVSPESVFREVPPSVFISHGKESVALRKLKEFIETLGIEPLIVKEQASLDKDLPDKINLYLNQADFVIILATGDDTVRDKKSGAEVIQPRQNVIHEIGLAQKTHPGRVIYLLEEGANFPSNIRPKVWESFKQRNMMDAFLGIVRELRAYGILKVIKYPVE